VVPSDAHKAEFLYYVFEAAKTYLLANAGTTATSIVSKAVFQQLVFSIPPLPEQRAIAEALSDADALLDGLDRLIAKKRDLKQAAMQQLLTGKTRLPGFSGEWKPLVFGDLASPGMDRVNPKLTGGHAFCVELEHIEQKTGRLLGWSETAPQSSLKAVFAADDVLFGKLRAYLRKYWHASMPGVCSTEIWVLKAKSAVAPGYLYQLVQTDWFIDAASTAYGTHMPRSDWKVVRDLELRVPRKDEQAKIAGVLGDMDAEIDALKRRRDKAYDLKHAMMQELLTGKTRLVAPEADHA
jgi:type I restriction enzyme S subunit